jgi:multidrug efflux pump subunit AcrA (membrane-fusion protein)
MGIIEDTYKRFLQYQLAQQQQARARAALADQQRRTIAEAQAKALAEQETARKQVMDAEAERERVAESIRQEENARQGRASEATQGVNDIFSSFDDSFFDRVKGEYTAAYKPKMTENYDSAYKALMFALGRKGGIKSSSGQQRIGQMRGMLDTAESTLGDKASEYASGIRKGIDSERAGLLGRVSAAGGSMFPDEARTLATDRTNFLKTPEYYMSGVRSQPESYSPVGDLFSTLGGDLSGAASTERDLNSRNRSSSFFTDSPKRPTIVKSTKVVR